MMLSFVMKKLGGKEPLLKDRKLKLDGGSNFLHLMATVDCSNAEFR